MFGPNPADSSRPGGAVDRVPIQPSYLMARLL